MNDNNMENAIEPFFKGTVLEDGYGYIPQGIMRDSTFSRDARALYAYFMSFAGKSMTAFPSVKTICTELGFKSKDTYYKYLKELKGRGLISSRLIKNEQGKFQKNIFSITLQKNDVEEIKTANCHIEEEKEEKKPFPKNKDTENRFLKKPYTVNQETKINNIINNNNIINIEEEETPMGVSINNEIVDKYKKCISQQISDNELIILSELQNDMGKELILKAIDIAMMKNGKNLGYIKAVLEDWRDKGLKTTEDVELYLAKWTTQNQKAKENRKKQVERRAKDIDINEKRPLTNFADYPGQREYDYDDLEKKLLGWDK